MNSILITGCNRGLGLGLVKALLKLDKPTKYIFATCRHPDQATELNHLKETHRNVYVLKFDVTNYDSYETLVKQVADVVQNEGLNVLFNNAGIAPKSTRLSFVKEKDLLSTFETNTVAPVMLSKAFLPLLKKASHANSTQPFGVQRASIINMSSSLGSIESNVEGGLYAYRLSKAGLNAATKSMSIDLKDNGILCVSMHPGWVQTDMGGTKAPMDVESSCQQMINTILNLNESNNGTFIQYDGKLLKW